MQRLIDLDALTEDHVTPEQPVLPRLNCGTCGGELYPLDGDGDLLAGEIRALAQSGQAVSVYGDGSKDWWALVGPEGDHACPLWAGHAESPGEAARAARKYMGQELQVDTPDADVSPLVGAGLQPQWARAGSGETFALRVWRGDKPAFDSISVGTPEECVEKAVRVLNL